MRQRSVQVWNAIRSAVGADEIVLMFGLALVCVGLWMTWRPGTFLAPGAVLVWIALPSRQRFIATPPAPPSKEHA